MTNAVQATNTFRAYADDSGHLTAEAFRTALASINPALQGRMDRSGFSLASQALGLTDSEATEAFHQFGGEANGMVEISSIVSAAASTAGTDGLWDAGEFLAFLPNVEPVMADQPPAEPATEIVPKAAGSALPLGISAIAYGLQGGPLLSAALDLTSNYPLPGNVGTLWSQSVDGTLTNPNNTLVLASTTPGRLTPAATAALRTAGLAPLTTISASQGDIMVGDMSNASLGVGVLYAVNDKGLKLPNVVDGKPYPTNLGLVSITMATKGKEPDGLLSDILTGNTDLNGSVAVSVTASVNISGVLAEGVGYIGSRTINIPALMAGFGLQASQQVGSIQIGANWKAMAQFKDGHFTGMTLNGKPFDPAGTLGEALKAIGVTADDLLPQTISTGPGIPTPAPAPDNNGGLKDATSYTTPDGVTHFIPPPREGEVPSQTINGVTHYYPPDFQVPTGAANGTGVNKGRLIASSTAAIPATELAKIAQRNGAMLGDVRLYHAPNTSWDYYIPMPQIASPDNDRKIWSLATLSHKPTTAELQQYAAEYKVPVSALQVSPTTTNGKTWWDIKSTQKPSYPGGSG